MPDAFDVEVPPVGAPACGAELTSGRFAMAPTERVRGFLALLTLLVACKSGRRERRRCGDSGIHARSFL